ncbi:polysaccharide biosynthesis protein [Candidatus Pelagibacter sp.]|nr:polysaccharide biosynthesis protein [Candidatus Pelagibacter sp.]
MQDTKKHFKKIILIFFDVSLSLLAICIAYFFRYENLSIINNIDLTNIIIPSLIFITILFFFNVYGTLTRYLSFEFSQIFKMFLLFAILHMFYAFFVAEKLNIFLNMEMSLGLYPPRSTAFSIPIILFFLLITTRKFFTFIINLIIKKDRENNNIKLNCAIYGAGDLGNQLYDFLRKYKNIYNIHAIIDDNTYLQGQYIHKSKILSLQDFIDKNFDKNILLFIAIKKKNSVIRKNIKKIISSNKNIRLIFVRDNKGVLNTNSINPIEIDVDYIMGYSDKFNNTKLEFLKNKNILVTGGGGSIGSELVKQIYKIKPQKIHVVDNNEHNLFKISHFFKNNKDFKNKKNVNFYLGNLANFDFAKDIFKNKIDYVFHSAAYKHVSLVEKNIISSVENNIVTTFNLCKLSETNKIIQFVNISSDKAVKPKSFMGATKNVTEKIVQNFNNHTNDTNFYSVRFGNVLNSSGSVIPIFQEQILANKEITITSMKATRYFMSIKEAIDLILTTLTLDNNNKTFYFDMGKPIKIYDLAKKIANYYGKILVKKSKNINEIEYKIIGLSKGEKLHEILTTPKNILQKTKEKKILSIKNEKNKQKKINERELIKMINTRDSQKLKKYIFQIAQKS